MALNKMRMRWLSFLAITLNAQLIFGCAHAPIPRSTTPQIISVAKTSCLAFEGSEKVALLSGVVFVGEHHGTNESPAFFGSLVCNGLKANRSVHVAFELPESWSPLLEEFITSDLPSTAFPTFLQRSKWDTFVADSPDGRTSMAMVELIKYLRLLRQSGNQVTVSAFDTRMWEAPQVFSDIGMAAMLTRNIERAAADVTFVLSGEYHTRLLENTTPFKRQPMAFLVAAARPEFKVRSIVITYSAGNIWGCKSKTDCGELYQPVQVPLSTPKLTMFSDRDSLGYTGDFYVGAISPSKPYYSAPK